MRIVFFDHPGTNSRQVLLDMARGFERAGCDVLHLELEPIAKVYSAAGQSRLAVVQRMTSLIGDFLRVNRVDFSVGMWANALGVVSQGMRDGEVMSFFEALGQKHLMFWLDAPHWAGGGGMTNLYGSPLLRGDAIRHYVNNTGIAREMMEVLGFGPTLGRGYGIDETVFRPVRGERVEFDVVFGTGPGDPKPSELMLRELDSDEPDVEAMRRERAVSARRKLEELAATFDAIVRGEMMELLSGLLDRRLESAGTPMLDDLEALERDGLGRAGAALRQNPAEFVRACTLVRGIEAWRRAFTLCYLSRRLTCGVFGAADFGLWPCEATLLGNLDYGDMSRAYARGRVGLNVMRWQDDVGLNVKPYEITASGSALLCERREGLSEAFEVGREVEAFGTPNEAVEKARALIEDDARREAMAEAGLARTLRDHTWTRVAEDLVEFMTASSASAMRAAA